MNKEALKNTIAQLFTSGKGLLAMDESTDTCNKRFAAAGIPQTIEMRRSYRDMIVTTPGLHESIGGAILFDETIRQQTKAGVPFADALIKAGIIPGIKVDMGAKPMAGFPGEKLTEGLDGLRDRLEEYKKLGARFAKWRAVISIGDGYPTIGNIEANTHALASYAAICQEAGIVPIVEPEVLMNGNHTIQRCFEVTEKVLKLLFYKLFVYRVVLEGMILKPNMVIAGTEAEEKDNTDTVAEATVTCLLQSVPAAVPAIAFLSGGQAPQEATEHLNAMNKNYKGQLPWTLTFSFARAVQQPALEIWKGADSNIEEAQKLLYQRARMDALASRGEFTGD